MNARARTAIRRLTLAFVLGVVTTLVVAGPLPPVVQRLRSGEWGTVPALPVSTPRGKPPSPPPGGLSHETVVDPVTDWRATHWPHGEFVPDWPKDIVEYEWVWRLQTGWPFRAFTGECWGRRDGGFDARGATLIVHPFQRKTLIPLRPLWRGLALDTGLLAAIREEMVNERVTVDATSHPDSIYAGAIGAALWGAFRHDRLKVLQARAAA